MRSISEDEPHKLNEGGDEEAGSYGKKKDTEAVEVMSFAAAESGFRKTGGLGAQVASIDSNHGLMI